MYRSLNSLKGYSLQAQDGEIGTCHDFLWDDGHWVVRYLVADTGTWLPGRKVVISPISLGSPDWETGRVPVELTQAQIENGPGLDEHAPVSRRYEREWNRHFHYGHYWIGQGPWGAASLPVELRSEKARHAKAESVSEPGAGRLRSANEVCGYTIRATDGNIGHVEDLIVDDETWRITIIVVDTRDWLPGRTVQLLPLLVEQVDWENKTVTVNLTRETVRHSPEYDPRQAVNREAEGRLADYYGRPVLPV